MDTRDDPRLGKRSAGFKNLQGKFRSFTMTLSILKPLIYRHIKCTTHVKNLFTKSSFFHLNEAEQFKLSILPMINNTKQNILKPYTGGKIINIARQNLIAICK